MARSKVTYRYVVYGYVISDGGYRRAITIERAGAQSGFSSPLSYSECVAHVVKHSLSNNGNVHCVIVKLGDDASQVVVDRFGDGKAWFE